MADQPGAEKTEQPTARRLSKAREQGQVPQSAELMSFTSILVLTLAVTFMAPHLLKWCYHLIRDGAGADTSVFVNSGAFINFLNKKFIGMILVCLPIVTMLTIGSILSGLLTTGINYSPQAIKFRPSAISFGSGIKKLINSKTLVRFLTSVVKLTFITTLVWFYISGKINEIAMLRWAWSLQILAVIMKLIFGLMIRICIGLLIIGIADFAYQKWKYIQELKMTKQEVKDERRNTEGAPEVKSRIRSIQIQMALKRMLQEVPKANVVLVNPTHYAVALRYDAKTMSAPELTAKGADHLAEKIREIARAYGIPIIRRPELTRAIYHTVEPGQPIPDSLYVAVAEVLALIYRLKAQKAGASIG